MFCLPVVQLHLSAICNTACSPQPAIRRNMKQIRANNNTFPGSARAHCRNAKHARGSRLVRGAALAAVGVGPLFPASLRGGSRLCANLSRDAHHLHHRHLIGTRRRTGPSRPAALEWRVGLARGERPQPDSANLSLLSGEGRPAHPSLHHGRTGSLASEPGHGGGAKHLPQQPAHPRPHPPPRILPFLFLSFVSFFSCGPGLTVKEVKLQFSEAADMFSTKGLTVLVDVAQMCV